MARIFIEGFESGGGTPPGWSSELTFIDAAALGMSGDYALSRANTLTWAYRTLYSNRSEIYLAFKYKASASSVSVSSNVLVSFIGGDGQHIGSLRLNTAHFVFYHQSGLYVIASSANVFDFTDLCLIEVYYKPLNSNGQFILKVNGGIEIDYTGDTVTATLGQENILTLAFGYGSSVYQYYDDVVCDDSNWIGNSCILPITVTGAGAANTWTPSAGSNYACVDEIPANDSDYVATNSSGAIDTYTMSDLPSGVIQSVNSVRVISRGMYEGSPLPTKLKHVVRLGGTDYPGVDVYPPLTYGYVEELLEVRPTDSGAWTETNVNDMEVGVKATT